MLKTNVTRTIKQSFTSWTSELDVLLDSSKVKVQNITHRSQFLFAKSKLKPWPNGKCLTTKHHQTLFGDQTFWCLKPWPNGSNMFYQTSSNNRTQGVVGHKITQEQANEITHLACASQTCLIYLAKRTKHHQTNMRTKEMFDVVWSNVWWRSNTIKHHQTPSNIIKHHQTRWPNGKMFDHQTMFDDVWSSNISRLARA